MGTTKWWPNSRGFALLVSVMDLNGMLAYENFSKLSVFSGVCILCNPYYQKEDEDDEEISSRRS